MEVANRKAIKSKKDWDETDRRMYYRASQQMTSLTSGPGFGGTANTFFSAVFFNTQNYYPNEYDNIWVRHVYYDLVALVLRYPQDKSWNKIKEIRFFDAVTITTGIWGLSATTTTAAKLTLSSNALALISAINKMLFEENMIVIKNLFFDIKFPFVIPRGCFTTVATPVEISGLEFDLKMVEFEQNLVATYITNHQSQFTSSVISDLNSLMDDDWKQFFVPANLLASVGLPWAKKLLNVSSLDFMEYSHRVAIGKAMVYNFHSKSEAEYLKQISITPRAFTL